VAAAAVAEERVEDENCNIGEMESMEMDTESGADHPASASAADVPCSHPPTVIEPTVSTTLPSSSSVDNLSWFVSHTFPVVVI